MKNNTFMLFCALCLVICAFCLFLVGFGLIYAGVVGNMELAARLHEIVWGSGVVVLMCFLYARMS